MATRLMEQALKKQMKSKISEADRFMINQVLDYWYGLENQPSWDRNSHPEFCEIPKKWFNSGL